MIAYLWVNADSKKAKIDHSSTKGWEKIETGLKQGINDLIDKMEKNLLETAEESKYNRKEARKLTQGFLKTL